MVVASTYMALGVVCARFPTTSTGSAPTAPHVVNATPVTLGWHNYYVLLLDLPSILYVWSLHAFFIAYGYDTYVRSYDLNGDHSVNVIQ